MSQDSGGGRDEKIALRVFVQLVYSDRVGQTTLSSDALPLSVPEPGQTVEATSPDGAFAILQQSPDGTVRDSVLCTEALQHTLRDATDAAKIAEADPEIALTRVQERANET